jgi:hypothetical protein
VFLHNINIKEIDMFPTHKDCVNFRNGFCASYRIPVNPDGTACPRFTNKDTMPLMTIRSTRQPLLPRKNEEMEIDLLDLKRRLYTVESRIKEIKEMLRR